MLAQPGLKGRFLGRMQDDERRTLRPEIVSLVDACLAQRPRIPLVIDKFLSSVLEIVREFYISTKKSRRRKSAFAMEASPLYESYN